VIDLSDRSLLMLEPRLAPSADPVLDELTCRMAAALNAEPEPTNRYRGIHHCTGLRCDATSDNARHVVAGRETNSLAVHYLAHHRAEVPDSELAKIEAVLPLVMAPPTDAQLAGGCP
jgi:hypothetical protein